MFPNMEVIVQRGDTPCLFNVSLYGSYCTKRVHILFVQCFLIWKLLYKGDTHLVCSMFPYMEVIVQRGVHILFVQCVLIWKLMYKGCTHLVCSMFPNMEVIVQRGTHLVSLSFLIWKLLYKGSTHLVSLRFLNMEVIVQRGYTSCLFDVS